MRGSSSIGRELLWLLVFIVIFALISLLWMPFANRHHFNDTIAIILSAIFSALVMIAIRAVARA